MNYLVIRSAYFRLQPTEIYIHLNQPVNEKCTYWQLIKPMISQIHIIPTITQIFGNKVTGQAHISDIARLRILDKYGGLYFDTDVISLRPFPNNLW